VNLDAVQAVSENHEPGIPNIKLSIYSLDKVSKKGECNVEVKKDTANGFGYLKHAREGAVDKKNSLICEKFWVGGEADSKPRPVLMWTSKDEQNGKLKVGEGQLIFDVAHKTDPDKYSTPRVGTTYTAQYKQPKGCKITDENNGPITFGSGQSVLPDGDDVPCIETPLLRNQVGGFGMTDGSFQFDNLKPGYYAVHIEVPMNMRGDKKAYKVRTENDINSFQCDEFVFPGQPTCPSSDESCPMPINNVPPNQPHYQNVRTPCAGKWILVDSSANPTFQLNGGSYKEGEKVHLCDIKIVKVEGGVNAKLDFHLFTEVPIPSRWKGLVLDDVAGQANPKSILFQELIGVPNMPVGIRDFRGVKLTDVTTDVSDACFECYLFKHCLLFKILMLSFLLSFFILQANGAFEVLVPSSRNNACAPSASAIMVRVLEDHDCPLLIFCMLQCSQILYLFS
jgi:hypothetical protein